MGTSSKRAQSVVGDKGLDRWARFSGGEVTRAASRSYNGGARKGDVTWGRTEIGDITVVRPFDPERDRPLLRRLRSSVGVEKFTITVSDLDTFDQVIGVPDVYTGCVVTSLPPPEYDETASEGGEFSVTFMVEDVTP